MIEEREIIRSEGGHLTIGLLNVHVGEKHWYELMIKVDRGVFCGSGSFYLDRNYLLSTLNKVSAMHQTLTGQCEIKDESEEPFIVFKMEKCGHLSVTGQFGERTDGTYLTFRLASDQTVLPLLISTLKSVVSR